jgi:hypothetical protein
MASTRDTEMPDLQIIDGGKIEHRGGDRTGGKLTGRQHGFINSILKDHMNQSDAYRANYTTSGMTDKSVWEKASRLFALDKVRSRLEAGRKAQEQIAVHSGAALRADLISKLKVLTGSEESDAVKIRAIEVLGKTELVSLFLDRQEVNTADTLTPEQLTEQLEETLKRAFGQSA